MQYRLFPGYIFTALGACMSCCIPDSADVLQPKLELGIHNGFEFIGIQQSDEIILIRDMEVPVDGIHPFYGSFHGLPAGHGTNGRINGQDFFCIAGNVIKRFEFSVLL